MGETEGKAAFLRAAASMYEELRTWRAQHLEASLDEIAEQVSARRRVLMGALLSELAEAADEGVVAPVCERCGASMTYKGTPGREVLLGEGVMPFERAYWYCGSCEEGFFPPGRTAEDKQASLESQDDTTGVAAGSGDSVSPSGG